jgi:hypothetical protein
VCLLKSSARICERLRSPGIDFKVALKSTLKVAVNDTLADAVRYTLELQWGYS